MTRFHHIQNLYSKCRWNDERTLFNEN